MINRHVFTKIFSVIILLVTAHRLSAQSERLFAGLQIGGYRVRSFYLPDSRRPSYFFLQKFSTEGFLGLVFTVRINEKIALYTGYNYITFTESHSLGQPAKGFSLSNPNGWGYGLNHFPLLLGYSLELVDKPNYRISMIPKIGIVYSGTEVNMNMYSGDTLWSDLSGNDYVRLLARRTVLPEVAVAFEVEYRNWSDKIRKVQINIAFAKGFRKLYEHDIGPAGSQVKTSSRGTFFQVSISQHFALADFIPRKLRQKIKDKQDSKLHRILYFNQTSQGKLFF